MKSNIKVVIIDDDEIARDTLIFELRSYPALSVEASARNCVTGRKLILNHKPDLLFLDIELPDNNGLDFLRQLKEHVTWNMQVILYTAFDKYMLPAFCVTPFGYLLKPIEKGMLKEMLDRYLQEHTENSNKTLPFHMEFAGIQGAENSIIVITPTNDLQFVRPAHIGYFKYSQRQWEAILTNGQTVQLRRNLKADQLLEIAPSFEQIHQSYIINMNYLIMIRENRQCIFYPPFDKVTEVNASRIYLKRLKDKYK